MEQRTGCTSKTLDNAPSQALHFDVLKTGMDGWMDGWMDAWTDVCLSVCMKRWVVR